MSQNDLVLSLSVPLFNHVRSFPFYGQVGGHDGRWWGQLVGVVAIEVVALVVVCPTLFNHVILFFFKATKVGFWWSR